MAETTSAGCLAPVSYKEPGLCKLVIKAYLQATNACTKPLHCTSTAVLLEKYQQPKMLPRVFTALKAWFQDSTAGGCQGALAQMTCSPQHLCMAALDRHDIRAHVQCMVILFDLQY